MRPRESFPLTFGAEVAILKSERGRVGRFWMEIKYMKQSSELVAALEAGTVKMPDFSSAIASAIESEQIRLDVGEVKATVSGKSASLSYVKTIPCGDEWLNGALALTDGDARKVSGFFWYGFDLGVRNQHRPGLVAQLEGPAKIIERTSKDLVAAGLYDTIDEARSAVVAGRKEKGLPV